MTNTTPYANLDPHLILDAIESVGLRCNGSLLALNSYENRVYQIGIEDAQPMIAKFYRPERWSDEAILEEHQFSFELTEQEIPVIAPWVNEKNQSLHHYQNYRFALFPRRGGRALELEQLDQLAWMGRFIGRLHAVGSIKPFQHRPRLGINTYGYNGAEYLIENNFVPEYLKNNYAAVVNDALQKVKNDFENVGDIRYIRLHGDMHAGNILWNDAGPHIVDLDDCLMGPAVQDMWMLLSGNPSQIESQLDVMLNGYQEFHDFNWRELQLISSLRILRMVHYSTWLAKRWQDPAFPLNFPWFTTNHYWQEQIMHLRDALEMP